MASVYGTIFSMGIHPASGHPNNPIQLMDKALAANLQGIELPATLLQNEDITKVAHYAQEHELFITLASGGYDPNKLTEIFDLAVQLGARTVRTVVGGAKIGGDYRPLAGCWQSFLQEVLAGLQKSTTIAE